MRFEVKAKCGRGWTYLGIYKASCSRSAALHASYVHNRKILAVRPEDSLKWFVYRFKYIASLASGV